MPTATVIANPNVGAELGHLGPWLSANGFTVTRLTRDDVLPVTAADDADLLILLGSVWTMTRTMDASDDPPNAAAAIAAEADHATVAFRYGRAWGLQFHAEVDTAVLQRLFEDLDLPQWQWQQYVDALAARADENRVQANALFNRFWSEVGA